MLNTIVESIINHWYIANLIELAQYFLIVFILTVLLLSFFTEIVIVDNNEEIRLKKKYNCFINAIYLKYKSFCNYLNIKILDKFRNNKSKIKAQNKKKLTKKQMKEQMKRQMKTKMRIRKKYLKKRV